MILSIFFRFLRKNRAISVIIFLGVRNMQQIGLVTKVYENTAIVQIKRATACGGKCQSCSGCETTPQKVEVFNAIGAKEGQTVQMEMQDSYVLFAAFMVYIIPLVVLFIGYWLGNVIFANDLIAGITGVTLLIFSFLVLRKIDGRLKSSNRYQPTITKILS